MATNLGSIAKPGNVGIIGSGLIGRSWTMLFVAAGYSVRLYDINQEIIDQALAILESELARYETDGMLRGKGTAQQQFALVQGCTTLGECVAGTLHVQECVPESLDMKRAVFSELDALVSSDTVMASSSSAIPASQFTEDLNHRSQCLVAHPVNPPYLMRLVELVAAPWTDPAVVARTRALMCDLGQKPISLKKEVAGFIQPRIQYAIIMECVRLVRDDVMSVADVDKVLTYGLGTRWSFTGQWLTAHLNAEGFENYCERYAETIHDIACDSGPAVPLTTDSPAIQEICRQLEKDIPLAQLEERRKWRDEGVAKLAQIRCKMDAQDESSTS